jgi:hypothetical protein
VRIGNHCAIDDLRIFDPHPMTTGKIIFKRGTFSVDCTIRNLWDKGILLGVASSAEIPDRFELSIPVDSLRYPCRIIWIATNRLGVTFE